MVVGDADSGEVRADVVGSCAGEGVGSEVVGGIEDDVAGPDVVGDTGGGRDNVNKPNLFLEILRMHDGIF